MDTVMLADGYNGDMVECNVVPTAIDGDLLKLAVTEKPYLIRWVHKDDLRKAIIEQVAKDYHLPGPTNLREAVGRGYDAGKETLIGILVFATQMAMKNNQVAGPKGDYFVTLSQLETILQGTK